MKKQDSPRHAGAASPEETSVRRERDVARHATQPPRDGIVLFCMTIVSCAIAAMLYFQFSSPLPTAAACGLGAWAVFLLLHKYVRKSQQVAQLRAELARARTKTARSLGGAVPVPAGRESGSKAKPDSNAAGIARDGAGSAASSDSGVDQHAVSPDVAPQVGPPEGKGRMPAGERGRLAAKEASPSASAALPEGPVWSGRALPPEGEGLREQWSFRPRGENAVIPGFAGQGGVRAVPGAATVETDLELVQRKIKALADEVNFAGPLKSSPRKEPDLHPKVTAEAIEDSIGALKVAATNMRERAQAAAPPSRASNRPDVIAETPASKLGGLGNIVIPETAQSIAGASSRQSYSEPSSGFEPRRPDVPQGLGVAGPSAPAQKSALARAIEHDSVEMLLSPIVALQANDLAHYEVVMRLRDASGNTITVSEAELLEMDPESAGSFDAGRFNRAVQLVQRMEAKSRTGYLLTEVSGAALSNRTFLETFARTYESRPKIAQQLVFIVAQEAIDEASPAAWQSLSDMNSIGFRFALGGLRHVRTNFAELAASGFSFVRIDAGSLVNGLQAGDRRVEPEELFQRAALAGLTIIATDIESVQVQAALIASGVEFGEGRLFGTPRTINLGGEDGGRSAAA